MAQITFVTTHYGIIERGAETYVGALSAQLTKLGHSVSIVHNSWAIPTGSQIVINVNGRLDALLSKFWCLVHGAKLLISGQSGLGWDDKLNLWLFPDVFIGLTKFQCAWAKRVNPFVHVECIPNGVDLDLFNSHAKPHRLDIHKPIILFVGANTPAKRADLLLAAASHLDCSVLKVGSGGDLQVPHSQMPSFYTASDIFSYPTNAAESFGIVLLEAMACNLPVVCTDDPIRREIVGEAGLFIDPTNKPAYTAALSQALNTKWGDRPRQQASKFSWGTIATKYDQIFTCLNLSK